MRSLLLSLALGLGSLGFALGTPTQAKAADHANIAAANDTTQVAWGRWGWGYPGYRGFYRGYYPGGWYGGYYPRYYGGFYPRYYGGWYGGWGGFYGPRYYW